MRLVLAGNANVGKTSVFNLLTKSDNHVGNWHGVTTGESEKRIRFRGVEITVSDLPGIYSLYSAEGEEAVSRDRLEGKDYDCVINVCEVSNLPRNLFLTDQLLSLGVPVVLAVNMVDELKKTGRTVDFELLSRRIGVPVIPVSAKRGGGIENILPAALDAASGKTTGARAVSGTVFTAPDGQDYERRAAACYERIDRILSGVITDKAGYVHGASGLDRALLSRKLAIPLFLLITAAIFFFTFGPPCTFLSNLLGRGLSFLQSSAEGGLENAGSPAWLTALLCSGVIRGMGGIAVFLPQILALFFFLAMLEDSGYMSRIAFFTDGLFSRIGLSGKSAFTLLMGFGCSAAAVSAAKNLGDPKAKLKTVLLTPFFPCGARLPVFAALGALFFPGAKFLIVFALYIMGVLTAVLLAALFQRIPALRTDGGGFIMEMPPYRLPSARRALKLLRHTLRDFFARIGTLIFSVSVIVWVLSNFSLTQGYVPETPEKSVMAAVARCVSVIFVPLGFPDWRAATAVIGGLAAKEVVLTTLQGFGDITAIFGGSPLSAFSFMTFVLLYTPCVAAVGAIARECGTRWAFASVGLNFSIAYIVSFFLYQIGCLFAGG